MFRRPVWVASARLGGVVFSYVVVLLWATVIRMALRNPVLIRPRPCTIRLLDRLRLWVTCENWTTLVER